jgi:hypothetical protein
MGDLVSLAEKIEEAERALKQEAEVAARSVGEQETSTLAFCRRLMAIIRVVGDATTGALPNSGWRAIVISLLVKTFATVRSAHTLAEASHGREVTILVRSALESLITARFIAKTDSVRRAKRWVQYAAIVKARLLKKQPNLSTKPKHTAARGQILAQAQRLKGLFRNENFWASGLRKGSLRDLAEDVGMLWYHDHVYWWGSQATHGSSIAVESYVEIAPDSTPRFNMGLSGRHLRGELAVCCELVIQGLDLLNEIAKLGIESLLTEIRAEYKSVFGFDSGAEMTEG